jgi:hypothetical protein
VVAPPGRRRRVLRVGARQRRDYAVGVRRGRRVSTEMKPTLAFLSMCTPTCSLPVVITRVYLFVNRDKL